MIFTFLSEAKPFKIAKYCYSCSVKYIFSKVVMQFVYKNGRKKHDGSVIGKNQNIVNFVCELIGRNFQGDQAALYCAASTDRKCWQVNLMKLGNMQCHTQEYTNGVSPLLTGLGLIYQLYLLFQKYLLKTGKRKHPKLTNLRMYSNIMRLL